MSTDQVVERNTPIEASVPVTSEVGEVVEASQPSADELTLAYHSVKESLTKEESVVELCAEASLTHKGDEVAEVTALTTQLIEQVATQAHEAPMAENPSTAWMQSKSPQNQSLLLLKDMTKLKFVAEISEDAPVQEDPLVEVLQSSIAATSVKPGTECSLTFTPINVSFVKGVAFYNFRITDESDPDNDTRVSKRYSDFKALHAQLPELLANDQSFRLPALPKTSFLQGRKNVQMLEDRKTRFSPELVPRPWCR
ncbi:hypothetical protein CCR75_007055 [Bremia lactucae]|uniref:PX domain-containing protein n=1 Tax=Bremia lactucae TaxID=4779 RepID=A0A976FPF7_BRELC|nr:hypothetical protein CCR75_007055 [Bremia lactucae]